MRSHKISTPTGTPVPDKKSQRTFLHSTQQQLLATFLPAETESWQILSQLPFSRFRYPPDYAIFVQSFQLSHHLQSKRGDGKQLPTTADLNLDPSKSKPRKSLRGIRNPSLDVGSLWPADGECILSALGNGSHGQN